MQQGRRLAKGRVCFEKGVVWWMERKGELLMVQKEMERNMGTFGWDGTDGDTCTN